MRQYIVRITKKQTQEVVVRARSANDARKKALAQAAVTVK